MDSTSQHLYITPQIVKLKFPWPEKLKCLLTSVKDAMFMLWSRASLGMSMSDLC